MSETDPSLADLVNGLLAAARKAGDRAGATGAKVLLEMARGLVADSESLARGLRLRIDAACVELGIAAGDGRDRERHLVTLLGLRVSDTPHPSRWSTAIHEGAHFVVGSCEGLALDAIEVTAREGSLGRVLYSPPTGDARSALKARVALAVAGSLGEEQLLGGVDPTGVQPDLRIALARAGCVSAFEARRGDSPVEYVRGVIADVRETVLVHQTAVLGLARLLLDLNRLGRDDCLEALRVLGCPLPERAFLRDVTAAPAEEARVREVRRAMRAEREAN